MIGAYFKKLSADLETALKAGGGAPAARKRYALEVARLGVRLFSGSEKLAWCGVLAPFDLLNAMGVTSAFPEFVGAMLAGTGAVAGPLARAEQEGYPVDGCSYHRSVTGAALEGWLPAPDFLLATTAPCTAGLSAVENLARLFKKPLRILDVPQGDDPGAVLYLADQLRALPDFIERATGRRLEPARLRAAIENTNRARERLIEAFSLASAVPSPARPRDLINVGLVVPLLLGTEGAVEVAGAYADEFAARRKAGAAGFPGERRRLLWIQNRIQFTHPLDDWLQARGVVVVMDELNDVLWEPIDPADPYPGLARRILSTPLAWPIQRRAQNIVRLARAYRIDGVINPCHFGCRQSTGARGLVTGALREAGLPVLNLEVDCVDPRSFSAGQLQTRVEAFLELLDANLPPR